MNIKRIVVAGLAMVMVTASSVTLIAAQRSVDQTLTIGFIGAGEGQQVERDQQLYQAAVLAAEQINAGDDDDVAGISSTNDTRYDLTVTYYNADTTGDAVDAMQDAMNDDAVAVLGPQQKVLAQAIVDEGTPEVPLFLGASDSPSGTRVFRLASSYNDQAAAAADYLVNERKFTRVALVSTNTDIALEGIKTFKDVAGDDAIVADLSHQADELDFRGDARTIRDSQAQAVYVWLLDDQTTALLEALQFENWDGVVVYAGLDSNFIQTNRESTASILMGPSNWSVAAYDDRSQTFVSDYVARWGIVPSNEAAAYYDAVYMLAAAITKGGTSAQNITSQVGSLDYSGVQGDYANGNTNSLLLVEVSSSNDVMEAARYRDQECVNCPDTWWPDTTDENVGKTAVFTVGLIATLDGSAGLYGDQIEDATRLAIREINEAGGVVGSDGVRYTLDLRTYSVASADDAQKAFDEAVADGAEIVFGPDLNGQTMPNLQAAASAKVAQIVSATDTQVAANEPANYVFQMRSNDEALVNSVADYLLEVRDMTNFASVAVRTDYGLDAIDAFADAVSGTDDSQLSLRLEHNVDETDFSEVAGQIAASPAEAVVVWTTQPAAQSLLGELQKLNWNGVFVYGYLTADFVNSTPAATTIEVVGPVTWWSSAQDWVSQDFENRYLARYSDVPLPQTAAYYDAVYLIGHAIDDGQTSGTEIQSWLLEQGEFIGVQGQYSAATYENGELTRAAVIVGLQGGAVNELARYDGVNCLAGCNS